MERRCRDTLIFAQRLLGERLDTDLTHLQGADTDHALEIAPRVWWVGQLLDDDDFQSHVYLLEQGDQSVLFDPG